MIFIIFIDSFNPFGSYIIPLVLLNIWFFLIPLLNIKLLLCNNKIIFFHLLKFKCFDFARNYNLKEQIMFNILHILERFSNCKIV